VLLAGCALLGAGLAGVARLDEPLRAAATEVPPRVQHDVDVTWHHHRGGGDRDCPPRPAART
jgi:hypothetical protein